MLVYSVRDNVFCTYIYSDVNVNVYSDVVYSYSVILCVSVCVSVLD